MSSSRKTIAFAVAMSLLGVGRAQAQDKKCVVEHRQAQNRATIVVEMTVINDGTPCFMRRRFRGEPATSLVIRERPLNGTLVSGQSSVSYTPKAGFVGKDAFEVQWFGSGFGPNGKNHDFRTKVQVTVQPSSDEPDATGEEPERNSAKPDR